MRHEEDPSREPRCTQHGLHRQQLGVRHCRRDPRRYIPHSSTRFCIFRGAHLANCHYHTPYIQRNPGGRGPHQRLCSATPSSRLSLASMQLLQHTEEEHTSDEQYMYCTRGIHPAPPCMRQLHMCLHCNTGSHIERSPQLVDTAEKEVLV